MPEKLNPAPDDLPPGVPPPPSKAGIDAISKDQALIADEWAPNPPHPDTPDGEAKGS